MIGKAHQMFFRLNGMTWWNNAPEGVSNNTMGLEDVDYEQMIVNVPRNPYYWGNKYFMPKYIFS